MSADWPFLEAMPAERIELQRQLVDADPFLSQLGLRFCEATAEAATLALAYRSDLTQPTGILHGGVFGRAHRHRDRAGAADDHPIRFTVVTPKWARRASQHAAALGEPL